ncbi:MAG: NupC/NupG family nucleoside CNT transporter [Flavobacteriaceae bacterium]
MELIPSTGITLISILKGCCGILILLIIAFGASSSRKNIPWKTVILALITQLFIGICILKVPLIQGLFEQLGGFFIKVIEYTLAGSTFMFGEMVDLTKTTYIFAFQVLPVILFFSAITSVLYYLGIIQKIVGYLAWALQKIVAISGAESLSLTGNIFLGQTEAPLLIKAYLDKMQRSEIYLVMVGGMATVAGSVLAAYIGFLGGDDPIQRVIITKHLIAASVMAAPGAVAISRILVPPVGVIDHINETKIQNQEFGNNILSAITNGTTQGLKLAVNVGAMLLVFVALLALVNDTLNGLGQWIGLNDFIATNTSYSGLTIEFILGYLFAPLMWLIGVAKEDMTLVGQLLGIKLAASEFVAYIQLADLKNIENSIHLMYEKSIVMSTFILCGFANFSSIGIQLGGIGILAPSQRKNLSELGVKAVLGGTLVSLTSATMAGMILG